MPPKRRSCELPEGITQLHEDNDTQVSCNICCVSRFKHYTPGHNLLWAAINDCSVSLVYGDDGRYQKR